MRGKKRIFCILITIFAVLMDTSVIPFTGLNTAYCPRLSLITVITVGLLEGKVQGIIYGALAGLLLSVTVYTPAFTNTVLYILAGLTAGFLGQHCRVFWVTVLPALAAMTLYEGVMAFAYYFESTVLPGRLLLNAGIRILIGIVLAQLWFFPFYKLLKPETLGTNRR